MSEIIVLGAGMVGVCSALELQARGHAVVLVDRKQPGVETSYGNAGVIQAEAAEPYGMPRDIPTLFGMLLGRSNDFTFTLPQLIRQAPALWTYYRSSQSERHRKISRWHAELTTRSTEDHEALIKAAHADNLIAREGLCEVYRDPAALAQAASDLARIEARYGVTSRVLDGQAFTAEEPAITKTPAGAIHWLQSWSCSDPGELTRRYAALFTERGGRIERGDAASLTQEGAVWRVQTEGGSLTAEGVVMALGPWSPSHLRPFGYRVQMVLKRGYHQHFAAPTAVRRPFLDVENGVVAASMQKGLRITSGAALVPMNAKPDPRQVSQGVKGISEILDLGEPISEPQWYGTRPFMPDMLPVIGQAPRHEGLWFNFGHGHHGFTLGPTSALLLADAMEGQRSDLHDQLAPDRRASVSY